MYHYYIDDVDNQLSGPSTMLDKPSSYSSDSPSSRSNGESSSHGNTSTDQISTANCTEEYDYYEPIEKWLLGIVVLPFIFLGLISNVLSILIFSHRYMRKQTINWYLLILGYSDTVVLLGAFFVLTLPRLGEIFIWWKMTAISYYSTPFMYTFMTMAQTTSIWMTVAMSIHRFIGVCFPYKSSLILRTKHVRSLIATILVVAVIFNSTRFFEVNFQVCHMVPIDVELPVLRMTDLRMSPLYRKIFYEWAYTLIMFAIPFSILIIVNACVIGAIHKSRKIHAQLNTYDDGGRKQELGKEISTSIMLVSIVVSFLLCNTLAFAVNIMEKLELQNLYVLLVPWSNTLVTLNASINICIYCIFSERYRMLLFYYLRVCGIKRKTENNFSVTVSNY